MMNNPVVQVYLGGCHCGRVRFEVTARNRDVSDCNCSICTRKGFLHLIVPKEDFTLLSGSDSLTKYQFNTGMAQHLFCKICGIHSFYVPRSHPDAIDVNVRCLETFALTDWNVIPFDGRNWEQSIRQIR